MTDLTRNILNELTLEEKAQLTCGVGTFTMAGVPRLGIPDFKVLDGATGINYEQLFGDMFSLWRANPRDEEEAALMSRIGCKEERNVIFNYFQPAELSGDEILLYNKVKAELARRFAKNTAGAHGAYGYATGEGADALAPTCFPTGMLLAATFNRDVVNQVGHSLGREARAYGISLLLGTPNVNIHRDPLNGRLFEGFSEDPCLVSCLAPELAKGVEAEGVAADIKHFAANNQEKNRQGIDETIPERALHEIYLPGFKACVKDAKPASVMAAYNKINGTLCTENEWLLTELLRDEWGFEGVVISDWGAIQNQAAALLAGCDVNMPAPADPSVIVEKVQAGDTDLEKALDATCARILDLLLTYGAPGVYDMPASHISEKSRQTAYTAVCEGIVMLKNERDIFPLKCADDAATFDSVFETNSDSGSQVILLGTGATKLYDCGTGSAGVTTNKTSSIYRSLSATGVQVSLGMPAANARVAGTTYILVARVSGMEGNDRADMNLNSVDAAQLDQLVELKKADPTAKLGLILNVCGPVDISAWEPYIDGIFCTFLPGMEGGRAMADILVGRVNPSGKLPLTFSRRYLDTPTCLNFPGDGYHVNYGEGIYVGYRYYDAKDVAPLYPFGYGLSYSMFSIFRAEAQADKCLVEMIHADGTVESRTLPVFDEELKVSVDVANVGSERFGRGKEVVQLYIQDPESTLRKPVKELKAFEKVALKPGEKRTVTFTLKKEDFASYDPDLQMWVAEEGCYNLLIGNSSANILCTVPVYLEGRSPYSYSSKSTIKTLYENTVTRGHMASLVSKCGMTMSDIETLYQYVPNTIFATFIEEKCGEGGAQALVKFDSMVCRLRKH